MASSSSSSVSGASSRNSLPSSSTPLHKIHSLQNDILETIKDFEVLHNALVQPNPVAGSNKQIQTNINRIIINLDRIESNTDITNGTTTNNSSSSNSNVTVPMVPIDLLEHLADTEMNNPDIWLQSKLQDLIEGERKKQIQQIALKTIAEKLAESVNTEEK